GAFIVGAGLCGLSRDPVELILSRALQGLGGGGLLAITAMAGDLPALAGRSCWAAAMLAMVLGAWLGSIVAASGWRWIFVMEMPLGLAIFAIAAFSRLAMQQEPGTSVDRPGTILLGSLLACLVLTTSFAGFGADLKWPLVLGLLAANALLVASLLFVESHVPQPILPPAMWREPRRAWLALSCGYVLGAAILLPAGLQLLGATLSQAATGVTVTTGA